MSDHFDEEIREHIRLLAERYRSQGMSAEEADFAARRQFGNTTLLKEVRRDMMTFVWWETLRQDLRYAFRVIARNKVFAAVAILTLTIGIGANTAIFSVVNEALLRPMPYPDQDRLVLLWGNVKRQKVERRGASFPDFRDWQKLNRSFEAMAAFDGNRFTLSGVETPERLAGEFVSDNYFSLLGVKPALGRVFRADDDRRDSTPAAILSYGTWQRLFGGDPGILNRSVTLDGRSYSVIGVAPAEFHGLSDGAEVWITTTTIPPDFLNDRGTRGFPVLAKLRPGVSITQAQSDMDALCAGLASTYPQTNEARSAEVAALAQEAIGPIREPLLILFGAVGFVLLIACTNVVNLLLARAETRQRELALRAAIGAGRARLIRQLLVESGVLTAAGCAGALALAHFGIRILMSASPFQFPSYVQPKVDLPTAAFTMAVSCVIAFLLGVAPAIRMQRRNMEDALRQTNSRTQGDRHTLRFRDFLVVAEISLSVLLLIGASLMIRSMVKLSQLHPGYDVGHMMSLRVGLPRVEGTPGRPDAKTVIAANEIQRVIASLPSIQAAAVASDAPLQGSSAVFYSAEGQAVMNAQSMPRTYVHRVSPPFFRTIGAVFVAGRTFTDDEVKGNAQVVVVTENMTRRFWPGQDPIGKRVKVGRVDSDAPWLTIIGVVRELKYRGMPENPTADPDMFQVFNERSREFAVLVRTSSNPAESLTAIRSTLKRVEPSILIYGAGTFEERVATATARPRFVAWLMGVFAAIALFLAAIGIYGVLSYSVSRRTREIGVRMALGATRNEVLRMIVSRAMLLTILGLLAGTGLAVWLTRLMNTIMFGVTATDPVAFTAAGFILLAAALIASLLPANRASRIDPAIALREE